MSNGTLGTISKNASELLKRLNLQTTYKRAFTESVTNACVRI